MKFLESNLMPKPRVLLPLKEVKKILAWTKSVPGEINGLGIVERKNNDFLIGEAFILKQKVSGGSAKIDPLAFNQYVAECDDPSKVRFQWHSHGDISAKFFSETDIHETIAKWSGEYLISLVVNKRGDYRCRLDIFEPIYLGFEVPILIAVPVEKEILNFCYQEIEKKVSPHDHGFLNSIKKIFLGQKNEQPGWNQEDEPMVLPLDSFQFTTGPDGEENG